jgi:hypothetical protein
MKTRKRWKSVVERDELLFLGVQRRRRQAGN